MRWQSAARLLMVLIGIGCAAAVYVYSRKRPPSEVPPPVLQDPNVTSQGIGTLKVRSNLNVGKDDLDYFNASLLYRF